MKENTNVEQQEQDTITMTKSDYAKAIQSAEDKLRTMYSKKIKELESKLPKQKSDAEIDFENRLKALEAREKKIALIEKLNKKNIDNSIADFLKDDVDVDKFYTVLENLVNTRIEKAGYKPTGHTNNESISKEKWAKMSIAERTELYKSNPELAKKLMGI